MERLAPYLISAAILAAPCAGRGADINADKMLRDTTRGKSASESTRREAKRADHRNEPSERAKPFVGNTEAKKVHRRGCEWAEKIAPPNRDYFSNFPEAVGKGYAACKVCTPDSESSHVKSPPPAPTPGVRATSPFVGHRVTRKAHRRTCEWAGKISVENRVGFATFQEAKAAGYVACGKCKPEVQSPGGPDVAMEPPRNAASPPTAGAFIGHSRGKKVHRADCEWARKIAEKNRTYFTTLSEASAAGYAPCKTCTPDSASPAPPGPVNAGGGDGRPVAPAGTPRVGG